MKLCTACGVRKRAPSLHETLCLPCYRARERRRIEQSRQWIEEYARQWRRSAGRAIDSAHAFTRRGTNEFRLKRAGPPSYYHWLRHEAIMAYGGYRCACCGEGEPMFLTLDHINNDGARQRRRLKLGNGNRMLAWLRDRGYPKGFQVLCANCNFGRHRNGGRTCPHKREKKRRAARSPR